MNILFLSESFFPHGAGAELATYLHAKQLAKSGINIRVVTNRYANEPATTINPNFEIYRIHIFDGIGTLKYSILKRFDILLSNFLKQMIKWADVVYVPRYWFSAIPVVKAFGKPVIFNVHDFIPICPLATMFNLTINGICDRTKRGLSCNTCICTYEKLRGRSLFAVLASVTLNSTIAKPLTDLITLCDAVICVSNSHKDIITQANPVLGKKTTVIFNPVPDISNLDVDETDFGYFGGPSYEKGFYTLYRAMASLKSKNQGTIKTHITNFPNPQRYGELSALGFIPYPRLGNNKFEQIYRQISCVIIPSLWLEPWGYVLTEAILRRRLAIASRIGALPEQAAGCKGVFLVEPNNVKQLAETMMYVKGLSKESMADLGAQNKEAFKQKYNNQEIAKNFIKLCESVTN